MHTSRRVHAIQASTTLAVTAKAKELRASGVDIVSFAAGEPDFDTPARIKEAVKAALDAGMTKYVPVPGDVETRRVIAHKLLSEDNIQGITPEHITISSGAKQSLYLAFQTLLDPPSPGDPPAEVIVPTPGWVSYDPQIHLAGGRMIELPTTVESDFKITPEQLRAAITERSRVFVINSPSNPCGTMYSEAELRALAEVVADAASIAPDLVIISDEIYEKIIFGGIPHFSIGSVPSVADRVITINGLSKSYAMTGWRIGYAACPGQFGLEVAAGMRKLQSQSTTSIASFLLPAIRVALTQCDEEVRAMCSAFAGRAKLIYDLMREIPGMEAPRPTGAFYVFPDISSHFGTTSAGGRSINSAFEFAGALLEEAHVAVVPGEDFGAGGERCCRLTFATSEEQIRTGMSRIARFIDTLRT